MESTSPALRSAPFGSALDGLLASTSAFRNLRAVALTGLTLLCANLAAGTTIYLGISGSSPVLGVLGALLTFVIVLYGINAVGIVLMQEAQGKAPCSLADALLLSLSSGHRLLAVALLELLIVLLVSAAIGLVLVVCKIPFIGPVLLTFVFPLAAVVLGVVVFSLFYIMFPLAGPAVWSGSTALQAVARLSMIARNRLISVVLQQFMLFIILLLASGIIFSIVAIGLGLMSSMTSSIIGVSGAGLNGVLLGASAGGHFAAMAIGGALLIGLAASIPALIATKGMCTIYLHATAGMDFTTAEAQMQSGLATVRKKTEEARERTRQVAEQQMQKAREVATAVAEKSVESAAPAPAASAPSAATDPASPHANCLKCAAPVTQEDVFCGECGHKLK